MTVFLFAQVEAKPGSEDVLRQAAIDLVPVCRAEDGCIDYRLFTSAENEIRFFSEWRDEEDLRAHADTPHVVTWLRVVEEHAAGPIAVTPARKIA